MKARSGETVLTLKRYGFGSFRVRLLALALSLLAAAVAFFLLSVADFAREKPTGYATELEQIQKDISELGGVAFTPPIGIEKATTFVYRLYHRASLTDNLGEFKVAEAAIDKAIQKIGPSEDLCILKAHLDFKFHRLANTRRDLDMVPDLTACSQGRALKADLDLQEGRYEEAKIGYERIIQKNRTWDNLARLAYLRARMGDTSGADQLYIEAEDGITAKEMRSYAWVELQRGLLDLSQGRYENALAHYKQARKAYSGYWLVDEHIAEVLGSQRKFDEAVALYEKVIARNPRPEFQHELGDLYAFMGKPDRAKPWHEQALTAYLESAEQGEVHYYHHLAAFYADVREDGAEAVKWARKDLELRQNFATQGALAWALYRDGQFAKARDVMNKALSSGVKDAHVFFHAAMIHLAAGRADEGKQFLQRAAEINPHYENFHVHR